MALYDFTALCVGCPSKHVLDESLKQGKKIAVKKSFGVHLQTNSFLLIFSQGMRNTVLLHYKQTSEHMLDSMT